MVRHLHTSPHFILNASEGNCPTISFHPFADDLEAISWPFLDQVKGGLFSLLFKVALSGREGELLLEKQEY